MASPQQNRVLLGLESGNKLHDLLREPGMPSKKMLDEWLDNPEFDSAFRAASQKGKAARLAKGGQPEPDDTPAAPRPAVLRGQPTPAVAEKGRELSEKLTSIIGDGDTYRAAPVVAQAPAPTGDAALQEKVLARLRNGDTPAAVRTGTPGFSQLKLAKWRKDPAFAKRHDAAKEVGAAARNEVMAVLATPNEEVAEPAPKAIEIPDEVLATLLPEAEPAPNQSEPAPVVQEEPAAVYKPKPKYTYTTVLGIAEADQKWRTKEQALGDAEYLAKHHNRPCFVVQVLTEVAPAVTVREL